MKTFGERAFNYSGPMVSNNLPEDVKDISSKYAFKKALTTFLNKSIQSIETGIYT